MDVQPHRLAEGDGDQLGGGEAPHSRLVVSYIVLLVRILQHAGIGRCLSCMMHDYPTHCWLPLVDECVSHPQQCMVLYCALAVICLLYMFGAVLKIRFYTLV